MSKKQAEDKMALKVVNLREKLLNLPQVMQEAIANYFNMYNCAAWLYNEILTPDAKDYVDESINYARELNDLQALPDTTDPTVQQVQVDRLNEMIEEEGSYGK